MTVQSDGTVRHDVVVELPLEEAFWNARDKQIHGDCVHPDADF